MIIAEFQADIVNLQVANLFQWDVSQVIKIMGIDFGADPVEVHFCNKKSTSALVVDSTIPVNGYVLATIPDSLLTQPYNIVAYVYQTNGSTRSTTNTITIPVVPRPKPGDYVSNDGGNIVVPDSGVDLSSATATRSDILEGKTAFIASGKVTGTHVCPSLGSSPQMKTVTPTKAVQSVNADDGYYLSSVTVNPIPNDYVITTDANATASDIVKGKTAYVNGVKVTGTHESSDIITSFDASTGTLTITEV